MTRKHVGWLRMLLAFSLVFAVSGVQAAVSSDSYVRRNLVALWDGIDNAGAGVHDDSTTVWKDLSGNGFDGTLLPTKIGWLENGWTQKGETYGRPIIVGNELAARTTSRRLSVECCVSLKDVTKRTVLFGQHDSGLNIEMNSSTVATGQLRFYGESNKADGYSTFVLSNDVCATVAASCDGDAQWYAMAKNGAWDVRQVAGKFGAFSNDCMTVIGGEPFRWTYGFEGKYHACRLYAPELTEDELSVNAAIDAIRYRGADFKTLILPPGWHFDSAGDIFFDCRAEAGPGGKVQVGAETAAAVATISAAVNGTATATLTAVPDAGETFAGWEGDTWAIVEGEPTDASVTVSANRPAVLVARFAGRVYPSDGLYVTNGLVARYDGLDNAGPGLHDTTSTVWKDLSDSGNDGTVDTANVTWNESGWSNDADGHPVVTTAALGDVLKAHLFTAEMTCRPVFANRRFVFFGNYSSSSSRGFDLEWYLKPLGYRLYYGGNPYDLQTKFSNVTETVSLSVATSPSSQNLYQNGTCVYSAQNEISFAYADNVPVVGGETGRANMAFHGDFYSFRLYNRQLTADEVALNALADQRRFLQDEPMTEWIGRNGTDWNDSENWSKGLPSFQRAAWLDRPVSAAEVVLNAGRVEADELVLSNAVGETVLTLKSGSELVVRKAVLGQGARLVVEEGAVFSCLNALTIEGAAVEFRGPQTGRIVVGGRLAVGADSSLVVTDSGEGNLSRRPLFACGAFVGDFGSVSLPSVGRIERRVDGDVEMLLYRHSVGLALLVR